MEIIEEKIVFIDKPQPQFKFLKANRLIKESHVKKLMKAMKEGEWIPPIFVTKDNYIVDGQNRYRAFCNLCTMNISFIGFLRVLYINSDEDPVRLAIKLNTGQKRWLIKDYLYSYVIQEKPAYQILDTFLKTYNYMDIRASIQLLQGTYDKDKFQEGELSITLSQVYDAERKIPKMLRIFEIVGSPHVYKRDTILAFYSIYNEVKDWTKFFYNLEDFKIPEKHTKTEWLKAYRACL